MSKYFETKKGSLEDMVAGVTEGKQSKKITNNYLRKNLKRQAKVSVQCHTKKRKISLII